MTPATCTAFHGTHRFASGSRVEVALAMAVAITKTNDPNGFLVFDDATGRALDFDLRGTSDEITARLTPAPVAFPEPRGPGRPKLGVVAREVTLLPRHWDWLAAQPGGASVMLRKLVEQARRSTGDADRVRAAQSAAYNFISAMAGNMPGFEEATRALFGHDRRAFADLIAAWPADIRDHAIYLAFADLKPAED